MCLLRFTLQWTPLVKHKTKKWCKRRRKERNWMVSFSPSMTHIFRSFVSLSIQTLIRDSKVLEMVSPTLILRIDKQFLSMIFRGLLMDLPLKCLQWTQRVSLHILLIVMPLKQFLWDPNSLWNFRRKRNREILMCLSFKFSKKSCQIVSKEFPLKRTLIKLVKINTKEWKLRRHQSTEKILNLCQNMWDRTLKTFNLALLRYHLITWIW